MEECIDSRRSNRGLSGSLIRQGVHQRYEPRDTRLARQMSPQRARTSETHPLVFDTLKIGRGLVMMTICPGKKGASIYGAPWNRSLELDGQQIAKWEATSIVTLMRDSEFPKVGIPTSDCIRSAANIARHYQVPVHDLRAPCYDPFDDNILIKIK